MVWTITCAKAFTSALADLSRAMRLSSISARFLLATSCTNSPSLFRFAPAPPVPTRRRVRPAVRIPASSTFGIRAAADADDDGSDGHPQQTGALHQILPFTHMPRVPTLAELQRECRGCDSTIPGAEQTTWPARPNWTVSSWLGDRCIRAHGVRHHTRHNGLRGCATELGSRCATTLTTAFSSSSRRVTFGSTTTAPSATMRGRSPYGRHSQIRWHLLQASLGKYRCDTSGHSGGQGQKLPPHVTSLLALCGHLVNATRRATLWTAGT